VLRETHSVTLKGSRTRARARARAWAQAAVKQHQPEEALTARYKAGVPRGVPLRCRLLVNLGVALEAKGRPAKAVKKYRVALALCPEYPNALKLLGCAPRSRDGLCGLSCRDGVGKPTLRRRCQESRRDPLCWC